MYNKINNAFAVSLKSRVCLPPSDLASDQFGLFTSESVATTHLSSLKYPLSGPKIWLGV